MSRLVFLFALRIITAEGAGLTRAQAVDMALRHALEQVAGRREGDDPGLDRMLYQRASTFVRRSTVTSEERDGNIVNVEVLAEVDGDAVAATVGARPRPRDAKVTAREVPANARVLVLATEQLGPHRLFGWTNFVWGAQGLASKTTVVREVNDMGSVEATLSDGFRNAGFQVIDPAVLRGKLAPKPLFENVELSASEARSIASKSDADIVIIAKGVAKLAATTLLEGEMQSGQANLVARVVRVSDGKVLGATTQHAAQVHIDADTARLQALSEAARLAATDLTHKLGEEK